MIYIEIYVLDWVYIKTLYQILLCIFIFYIQIAITHPDNNNNKYSINLNEPIKSIEY